MESFLSAATTRAADGQASPSPHFPDIDAFLAWTRATNITIHSALHVEQTATEGVGATATSVLEVGDIVVRVPRAAALFGSPLPSTVLSPPHALALAACRAADAVAPWSALWPQMPGEGSWGLDAAGWSVFAGELEMRRLHEEADAAARAAHARIVSACGADAAPSWSRFAWAMSVVSSRAADLVVSGEAQPVILPLIDVLNHRVYGEQNCAIAFEPGGAADGTDAFVLRVERRVAAGETLTISYGKKENAELLHGYGFATRPNPFDAALLRVPLAESADPMFAMQRQAMMPRGLVETGSDGTSGVRVALTWRTDGAAPAPRFSPQLGMTLRLACASTTAQLFAALSAAAGDDDGDDDERPVDDELPDEALALLGRACEAELGEKAEPASGEAWWPHGAARVASAARRDLLEAFAAAARTRTAAA